MFPIRRFRIVSLVLAAAFAASACSSDITGPTSDAVVQQLEVYSGPLDPGGTNQYLFSLTQASTVQLMLAGTIAGTPLKTVSPVLRLQFATWTGSACEPSSTNDLAPRMTAALQVYVPAGTYCAIVSDALGTLTEPVAVTLRMAAPALMRTGDAPGTATFTNTLTPGGRSSRTFRASEQGTVSVTLNSFSTSDTVGLGLGVLASDGCKLTQIVHTRPGNSPQLTARVDAGEYCAAAIDLGTLTTNETFSFTIAYP